jgi:hypothetical protein
VPTKRVCPMPKCPNSNMPIPKYLL